MITQVIYTDVNNRELDNIYARSGDDEIREIQFIICRNDPPEKVEIPEGVSGQFRMIKSSGNFVVRDMTKTVLENGTVIFTVAVSEQMVNVQGTGYYDIRLSGGGYLYTASGEFVVDSAVISSGVLEDVSEVNGLVFPDDFLTTDDNVPRIDDSVISSSSVWSSFKTDAAIEEAIESIPDPVITYSYDERITNRIWVDDRPIYSRTYFLQNIPYVSDWTSFASPGNIRLIDTEVSAILYNGQCVNSLSTFNIAYNPPNSPGNLCYYHSTASGFTNVYVTIYYVKEGD